MAAAAFPRIRLSIFAGEEIQAKEPAIIPIAQQNVSEGINMEVVQAAKLLARNHAFHLGREFIKPVHARITFSVEHGVTFDCCSDPRLQVIYFKSGQHASAIPKSLADARVCQVEPTQEMLEQARSQTTEEVVFVDRVALALQKEGITHPQTIELEIIPFIPAIQGKGLTTSSLRFPHLLLDLFKRQKQGELAADSSVCIVGPGLMEYQDPSVLPTCPQFAELLAMMPSGKFTLLDIDNRSLGLLAQQSASNFTTYDPMTYRVFTTKGLPDYVESPEYQRLFKIMKKTFSMLASAPNSAEEMLDGKGMLQTLVLRVQSEQLELREFDITKSSFKPGEQFDVIVATMSIINAYQQEMDEKPHANHFGKLTKFLQALKVGGTLYLDTMMMHRLLRVAGPEGLELGMKYLETMIGNQLQITKIPFSGFKEGATGGFSTITGLSMHLPKGINKRVFSTTSSDLWAITRTNLEVDSAQKGPIGLRLVQLLRNQTATSASSATASV